jgi:type I restriction enzyme R subunit
MLAIQFLEALFGRLPKFFKDKKSCAPFGSVPDTRKKLIEGLTERGFGKDQLVEVQKIIDAENGDLFDVIAHVAYALTPVSRKQRSVKAKLESVATSMTNSRGSWALCCRITSAVIIQTLSDS